MWIEYFGTAMSVIVAVSLMQKNIRWLRIINGIGAAGFAAYGGLIGAVPVLALNGFILVVDLWYLVRMRNRDDHFDYLPVDGIRSPYVRKFIDFHLGDIRRFMPDYDPEDREGVLGCLILRDIRPVSLILYRIDGDSAGILLDYSIPSYRDYASARYFFGYVQRHVDLGDVRWFRSPGGSTVHRKYLRKIGFEETEAGTGIYRMAIPAPDTAR